jgi:carbonic anhydrase
VVYVYACSLDAEMHMVHEDTNKAKAVVSMLFSSKAGKPSKLLGDVRIRVSYDTSPRIYHKVIRSI